MKKFQTWAGVISVAVGLMIQAARAEQSAVVKKDRVNVRAQASQGSEVITQLKKGESVTVVDEVTPKKRKRGEPQVWDDRHQIRDRVMIDNEKIEEAQARPKNVELELRQRDQRHDHDQRQHRRQQRPAQDREPGEVQKSPGQERERAVQLAPLGGIEDRESGEVNEGKERQLNAERNGCVSGKAVGDAREIED